jgi:oligoribonuclease NrnB/cAMP/cGMP phosphodiesterase (DHH superfamily)
MIHIFYHKRDLDGQCSGAIAKYYFLEENYVENIKMWPYDYGEPFPFDKIMDGEIVWMVDITTNPYEVMLEINKRYNLFVVDHHKSFIDFQVKHKIPGYFEIGKAACELTWEHCFSSEKMPPLVRLLGCYDIWNKSAEYDWDDYIMPIQMGIKIRDADPVSGYDFWKTYFNWFRGNSYYAEQLLYTIKNSGKDILKYQMKEDAKTCSFFAFPAIFENYKAICLNSTRFNSKVYESVWDKEKYDIMLAWVNVKGERYSVSIYTDKPGVDVSEIAKSFGGGGHVQAAGFQCKNVKPIINAKGEKAILIERFA